MAIFKCKKCGGTEENLPQTKDVVDTLQQVPDDEAREVDRIAAEKAAKKQKKVITITASIVAVCIAFATILTTVIIPTAKYNRAVGKYGKEWVDTVENASIGGTITFGAYEQDNNTSNGKEAIEWIVLDKDDMSLLLISKQALECQPYNTSDTDVTWETCSVRQWMNGTFLNNAFSAEEQTQIQNTTISDRAEWPFHSTTVGNATRDKVFLLSYVDEFFCFTTDESRKCVPTAYAKAQGAYTSDSDKTESGESPCIWWLRSPGFDQNYAAFVFLDGSIDFSGDRVNIDFVCVRPALWINPVS